MLKFKLLWDNHPTITGNDEPCSSNGKSNFSNQCAIRLGVALSKCGVDTGKIPGVTHCWQHKKAEGHVIRAEELANGLSKFHIAGMGKVQEIDAQTFKAKLSGKKDIIFFKDYWQRPGETDNRSGDHIDLWNGSRLTDWTTWFRIQLGISYDGYWSEFARSKTVLFRTVG